MATSNEAKQEIRETMGGRINSIWDIAHGTLEIVKSVRQKVLGGDKTDYTPTEALDGLGYVEIMDKLRDLLDKVRETLNAIDDVM